MTINSAPDGIPVLSRGKHHSPRRGACFMEMASVLAGEPWSDRPQCTHPLLGHLARMVNDYTSDAGRGRLAPLVPSVVGIRDGGLAWEVAVTAAVAIEALPHVPEPFQRPLAVGLLRCEELASSLRREGGPDAVLGLEGMRHAMADVPQATAWARRFANGRPLSVKQFRRRSAPHLMSCAVRGIADFDVPETDERLYDLLETAISVGRRLQPQTPAAPVESLALVASVAEADVPTTRLRRLAAAVWR